MVAYSELSNADVDKLFKALADATRRDIVKRTITGESTITQLAAAYDMSFAAVQKHVTVLEQAGLVTKISRGRERIVRGQLEQLRHVQSLLDQYEEIWHARITRLDALLAEQPTSPATHTQR